MINKTLWLKFRNLKCRLLLLIVSFFQTKFPIPSFLILSLTDLIASHRAARAHLLAIFLRAFFLIFSSSSFWTNSLKYNKLLGLSSREDLFEPNTCILHPGVIDSSFNPPAAIISPADISLPIKSYRLGATD